MRASFEEAKDIVLVATYETLYRHAEYESFGSEDIQKQIGSTFALGFTRRVITSLVSQDLLRSDQFDETSATHYALTDEGLARAETLPPLSTLTARLTQPAEDDLGYAPASDRIVSLNHNQVAQAEQPVLELLKELEADNGDPDQPGFRERLIGQIKAGRELLLAGEFRAYLLYETLVRALGELIKRYKNPTIVALANALLGAIVGQFFEG